MNQASTFRQMTRRGLRVLPRHRLLLRGNPQRRSIHLTFDDGPCPKNTPHILETLRESRALATFFVVGRQVDRHPELVRQIVQEGHEIGCHTYSHAHRYRISLREFRGEMARTDRALRQAIGHTTRLYRPPYGKLKAIDLPWLWSVGRTIVLWGRDPRDYLSQPSKQLASWFKRSAMSSGDIILLHDNQAVTAESLAEILTLIRQQGYDLTSCSSSLNRDWRLPAKQSIHGIAS